MSIIFYSDVFELFFVGFHYIMKNKFIILLKYADIVFQTPIRMTPNVEIIFIWVK